MSKPGINMTVGEILSDWLRERGYDGLVYPDLDCGCQLGDLAPCESDCLSCTPAYKHIRPGTEDDWAMWPQKNPPTQEQWDETEE